MYKLRTNNKYWFLDRRRDVRTTICILIKCRQVMCCLHKIATSISQRQSEEKKKKQNLTRTCFVIYCRIIPPALVIMSCKSLESTALPIRKVRPSRGPPLPDRATGAESGDTGAEESVPSFELPLLPADPEYESAPGASPGFFRFGGLPLRLSDSSTDEGCLEPLLRPRLAPPWDVVDEATPGEDKPAADAELSHSFSLRSNSESNCLPEFRASDFSMSRRNESRLATSAREKSPRRPPRRISDMT
jgi:hypothetical protein